MDSALSAKIAQLEGYEIIALHFNYGQRTQSKELECFRKVALAVEASENYEIDLPFFEQIGASALTDKSIDVPTGGIEEGVPVTYVPFRNGIFLSIAAAVAEKHAAQTLFIGVVEKTVQVTLIVDRITLSKCKLPLILARKMRQA